MMKLVIGLLVGGVVSFCCAVGATYFGIISHTNAISLAVESKLSNADRTTVIWLLATIVLLIISATSITTSVLLYAWPKIMRVLRPTESSGVKTEK